MQLQPGTTLCSGKYRIERVLGQGGFGITYLAVQTELNRRVAVKEFFMKEHCNRDAGTRRVSVPSIGSRELVERFRQKFLKEAQTIAAFDHPNIVRIHDIFEENGTAYYVMENIDGGALSDQHLPMSEEKAVFYIRQIGKALAYIHSQNVLHLDVKPSNILLRRNGDAVLIDFGISKRYDDGGNQTSSTPAGISKGYAPIEQYNQGLQTFSPATDVYSLGATLYKLITGETPPEASIVYEDGLPGRPANVSTAVWNTITKTMQPRRKDRPQTMEEFLKLLTSSSDTKTTFKNPINNKTLIHNSPAENNKPYTATSQKQYAPNFVLVSESTTTLGSNTQINAKHRLEKAINAKQVEEITFVVGEAERPTSSTTPTPKQNSEPQLKTAALSNDGIKQPLTKSSNKTAKLHNWKKYLWIYIPGFICVIGIIIIISINNKHIVSEKDMEIISNIEKDMVLVDGGSFNMGITDEHISIYYHDYYLDHFDDAKPSHQVTLSSFYICRHEVTQQEWEAVMGYNTFSHKGTSQPAENLSWKDCQVFIRRLNELTGKHYRLPTEAEWEYAARGGNKSKGYLYSGGNDIDSVAWHEYNSNGRPHEVMLKSPNELGLYDMSGNVREWCSDWYAEYSSSAQTNPKGPLSGQYHVNRGGSSDSEANSLSDYDYRTRTAWNLGGFRLAI